MADGMVHYRAGRYDAAAACFERAVEFKHDCAQAHLQLGLAYWKLLRHADAADCFVLAASFDPGLAEAHFSLATLDLQRGDADQARHSFEKALQARPGYADAHVGLGKLASDGGDLDAAYEHFLQAVQADPRHARAYSNLGYVLHKAYYRLDDALNALDTALVLDPQLAEAHCNRGMVLDYVGRCEEAIAECDRALAISPGFAQPQVNRALALLKMGDFARGWPAYEARRKLHPGLKRPFPYPEWDGSPLSGRTVLVYAEQGLGDEIMFASCLPDIISIADHCVIECHRKLETLFARSFPGTTVIGADQGAADLSWLERAPPIDCRIASGSLPLYFRASVDDFPRHVGYIRPDPRRVSYWRERVTALGTGLKIGLSWRGGTRDSGHIHRSLPLVELLPLLGVPETHFVSLQYTDCAAEIAALRERHGAVVHRWQEAIDDYDETAALISALDLIISVQTAAVHLSGGLNKPVWAMVPAAPEWRYQRSGETLPWYPSLRMYRQDTLGQWQSVIERVGAELRRIDKRQPAVLI